MRKTTLLGALGLILVLVAGPATGEDEPASLVLPHTPTDWLLLPPVDHRSRRPFNPDAVYERHLLDLASGVPQPGDMLRGEDGKEQAWKPVQTDAEGRLAGPLAYAYTRVVSPSRRIVLARLDRGALLLVNGVPVVGDIYGSGFGGLPVVLEKGPNDVYVRGVRGAFKLTFEEPPTHVFVADWSRTLPDLEAGGTLDSQAGLFVVNATEEVVTDVRLQLEGPAWLASSRSERPATLAPLSIRQLALPLRSAAQASVPAEPAQVEAGLRLLGKADTIHQETTLPLRMRAAGKAVIRTFHSKIDGSVQKFGLREPTTNSPRGIVLSLHGAGVNPRAQANAYSAKPDFWIAAATNRRPFGFDWQDWGRLDAYEVLDEVLRISAVDRRRVYLTGHSMGGHGTWHLAANDPDGSAAIAPSAGWISFDTYPSPRRKGRHTDLWQRADGPSLTLRLLENLVQLPTLIVHGTNDDNVPIRHAHQMEKFLARTGRKPETHYQDGAGHWWNGKLADGADCVDLPAIFDLFRKHEIPALPDQIKFTTWNPAVDASHHWLTVGQQLEYGQPSTVVGQWNPEKKTLVVYTDNVGALRVDDRPTPEIAIDGQDLAITGEPPYWLYRAGSGKPWAQAPGAPSAAMKSPARSGPLRQAFRNRFVAVYPSKGEAAYAKAVLQQARFDAQVWYYRGNGTVALLSNAEYLRRLAEQPDMRTRNVILYGNEDTNAAFGILRGQCPIRVKRKQVQVLGEASVGKDLGTCFVYPSRHGPLVGVMGSTGVEGARLGPTLSTFVSGAGFPDYVVFTPGILTDGDGGVVRAGFFNRNWDIPARMPK